MHGLELERSFQQLGVAQGVEVVRLLVDHFVGDLQPGWGVQAEKPRALGDGLKAGMRAIGGVDGRIKLVNSLLQPLRPAALGVGRDLGLRQGTGSAVRSRAGPELEIMILVPMTLI